MCLLLRLLLPVVAVLALLPAAMLIMPIGQPRQLLLQRLAWHSWLGHQLLLRFSRYQQVVPW
jgi:hypothetical protein